MAKKAKMFSKETDEFEQVEYKKDPLTLEKYRYICAEIVIARAKLNKLIATLVAGESYSSLEAEAKIKEMEKKIALISSKMTLISSSAGEINENLSKLEKSSVSGTILDSYTSIKRQMIEVEKGMGRLANMRAPELFASLAKETESLAQRVQAMEKRVGKTADLVLSARLQRAKGYAEEYEQMMKTGKSG
ncbi:MAG: hypothetical protein NT067_01075 [Candidatus Diapherotrites archaeon]|nr:hypothetical protein [Candidatus Diapherotrites archaeon]